MIKSAINIVKKVEKMILNGDFSQNRIITGIILTGSTVHGLSHPNSDIDIHVILDSQDKIISYDSRVIDDRFVQIMTYPFSKFVDDCLHHERKRPAAFACEVLYDPSGDCQDYIDKSKIYLENGPIQMTLIEKDVSLSKIITEVATIDGLIKVNKYASATLLINDIVRIVISLYNDFNGFWMSNDNYLIYELIEHDSEVGKLAEEIILSCDINMKQKLLNELINVALGGVTIDKIEYSYEEPYE